MIFQTSDEKEKNFLKLLDDNLNIIKLTYCKGGSQLKYFSHLNSLYIRASRAIVNHTSISEYHLIFFFQKNFNCLCRLYLIKTRRHSSQCYDIIKRKAVIFFIYSLGFYIGFYFGFTFLYYIDDDDEEVYDTAVT